MSKWVPASGLIVRFARAVRRHWPTRVPDHRRRTAVPPAVSTPHLLHAARRHGDESGCDRWGEGVHARRARTRSGVHSASSVAGCWVLPVRRRAPVRHHLLCLRRFGCCPKGLYVSAPAGPAPPSSGPAVRESPCGAPASLISSGIFPRLAPGGGQASVGHSSASFASSQNTTGRGDAGRSPSAAPPTNPFGNKGATP
jgi:hypothetical protein